MTPEAEARILAKIKRGLDEGELILVNGRPVCSFCRGNCGQCGLTGTIGNVPAQMEAMVSALMRGGRPRKPGLWRRFCNWLWYKDTGR